MTKNNTITVDADVLAAQVMALVEKKVAEALAAKGQTVQTVQASDPAENKANNATKALKEHYSIGGVDLSLDSISKRGTAYSRNNKMIIYRRYNYLCTIEQHCFLTNIVINCIYKR